MKFALSILSVFMLVAMLGSANAADLSLVDNNSPTTVQAGTTLTLSFNLTNSNSSFSYIDLSWVDSTASQGTLTPPNQNSINANQTLPLAATLSVPGGATGTINVLIKVKSTGNPLEFATLNYSINIVQGPALDIILDSNSQIVSIGENATITVKNIGNVILADIDLTEVTTFGATFSANNLNLGIGQTSNPITVILSALQNLKFGNNNLVIQAKDSGNPTAVSTETITVQKSFCRNGAAGQNLSISKVSIDNEGDGEDNDWELLDEIDVEVKVENLDLDNDVDTVIELGIFDSQGRNIADDMDYTSDSDSDDEGKVDTINIDDDDDVTVHFRFRVPADTDAGNYKLAVKAFDDDEGESNSCADSSTDLDELIFESFSISTKSDDEDFIAIENIHLPTEAVCGESARGSFEVFNVGKDDQDRVKINMFNSGLNLNQEFEINDFNKGDSDSVDFSFNVPAGINDGSYIIQFVPSYDYRSGDYRQDGVEFKYSLNVIGCSGTGNSETPVITASPTSDVIAGQEMTVKVTIVNTGSTQRSFAIDALSYNSWAELSSITPRYLTLAPDQSGEVVITLSLNDDAEGSNSFVIQATSDSQVYTQTVQVNVEAGSSSGVLSGFAIFGEGNSSVVWLVLINVILIVLIIVVAIRLSRK